MRVEPREITPRTRARDSPPTQRLSIYLAKWPDTTGIGDTV